MGTEMTVVKGLDIERYMGRWYEIASFPSFFQPRNGENTRATYRLNADGTVHVLNETWSGGKRGFIEGTAYKADPASDEAKLKVKFYVPPFLPIFPVVGDYWVLYIDSDYQYALIGQPSRKYLWQSNGNGDDSGEGPGIERYMGRWYEIASFPSFFESRDDENTQATYRLNADGTVHALNETWSGDKRGSIVGTAYKADLANHEAKSKVKFYVPPFLPIFPVGGDYWVLYIDSSYQYAFIGQPSRKYLWILCRETHMDEEVYDELLKKATEEGYDVKKLHKTPQAEPPPEGDEGPKDTKGIWWIKSLFGR